MLILWQTTSPLSEPSFLISTRSLAVTLPLTLPSTTTSLALTLAWTWPLRPTVTRLPGKLMAPSTRPSMYSDSEPVTSPLMTSDFPIVACSWLLFRTVLRGVARGDGSLSGLAGVLISGFSGSGTDLGLVFDELAGFHMEINSFRVSSRQSAADSYRLPVTVSGIWDQPSRPSHVGDQTSRGPGQINDLLI